MAQPILQDFSLERMVGAVEDVRNRVLRTANALAASQIPYAIAGGSAVAAWVSRVDRAAVRNTADVDIVIRRGDFETAKEAMATAGFVHQLVFGVDVFLDGLDAGPRDVVYVIFAGEKLRETHLFAAPNVDESEVGETQDSGKLSIVTLDALVRMKLTSFRDKDRTHLRDLLEVGLIDRGWLDRLPAVLVPRLQQLIDTPDG